MFGFSFKVLATTFCILGISWLALDYFVPSPPSIITIATSFKGSSFEYFGQRYRERLARAGVAVELRETAGTVENLRLLEDTKSGVHIAFLTVGQQSCAGAAVVRTYLHCSFLGLLLLD